MLIKSSIFMIHYWIFLLCGVQKFLFDPLRIKLTCKISRKMIIFLKLYCFIIGGSCNGLKHQLVLFVPFFDILNDVTTLFLIANILNLLMYLIFFLFLKAVFLLLQNLFVIEYLLQGLCNHILVQRSFVYSYLLSYIQYLYLFLYKI